MQGLAVQDVRPGFVAVQLSVQFVAGDGVTQMRHVHADLMRAAGQQRQFNEAEAVDALRTLPRRKVRA